MSLSFETISGYGPNGAVIHYAAQEETARNLGTGSLFLLVRSVAGTCGLLLDFLLFFSFVASQNRWSDKGKISL